MLFISMSGRCVRNIESINDSGLTNNGLMRDGIAMSDEESTVTRNWQ